MRHQGTQHTLTLSDHVLVQETAVVFRAFETGVRRFGDPLPARVTQALGKTGQSDSRIGNRRLAKKNIDRPGSDEIK